VLSIDYRGKIYQQASASLRSITSATALPRSARSSHSSRTPMRAGSCRAGMSRPARRPLLQRHRRASETAVSNMPIAKTENVGAGLKRVEFAPTPKMSSYLLFFGAGDFERVHRMIGNVDVGVIVKHGDAQRGSFALDTAAQLLPYYNDYFGTPYPLPKLDLIAAPGSSQFFGAMEKLGRDFLLRAGSTDRYAPLDRT